MKDGVRQILVKPCGPPNWTMVCTRDGRISEHEVLRCFNEALVRSQSEEVLARACNRQSRFGQTLWRIRPGELWVTPSLVLRLAHSRQSKSGAHDRFRYRRR